MSNWHFYVSMWRKVSFDTLCKLLHAQRKESKNSTQWKSFDFSSEFCSFIIEVIWWENSGSFTQKIRKKRQSSKKWTISFEFGQFEVADRRQTFNQIDFVFRIDFGDFHYTESSSLPNQTAHASNIVTWIINDKNKGRNNWNPFDFSFEI